MNATGALTLRVEGSLVHLGYYTASVALGTPARAFSLVVDTGSTMTILPREACEGSRSSRAVKRRDPGCTAAGADGSGDGVCRFRIAYLEGSSYRGTVAEDVAYFTSVGGGGEDATAAAAVVRFGCATHEEGKVRAQLADGVLGLGRGPTRLGLVDQLSRSGAVERAEFSLCLPSLVEHAGPAAAGGGAGILIVGPAADMHRPPDVRYTPLLSGPGLDPALYHVHLDAIEFIVPGTDGDGSADGVGAAVRIGIAGTGGAGDRPAAARAVVDSGSSYSYLPTGAFWASVDAIVNVHCIEGVNARADGLRCRPIDGPDDAYRDFCFVIEAGDGGAAAHDVDAIFPRMRMVFGGAAGAGDGSARVEGVATNYLFRHSTRRNAWCLGIFERAPAPGRAEDALIGGIFLRNTLVHFDEAASRIGFLHANCTAFAGAVREGRAAVHEGAQPRPPQWSSGFAVAALVCLVAATLAVAWARFHRARLMDFGLRSTLAARRRGWRKVWAASSPS